MGVYATKETGEWECEDCGRAFLSLCHPDSDTKPRCPYCRIATLESSHAELLEALKEIRDILAFHEGSDQKLGDRKNPVVLINAEYPGGDFPAMLSFAREAITRATEEKQ